MRRLLFYSGRYGGLGARVKGANGSTSFFTITPLQFAPHTLTLEGWRAAWRQTEVEDPGLLSVECWARREDDDGLP